jgi:hypothetical protein
LRNTSSSSGSSYSSGRMGSESIMSCPGVGRFGPGPPASSPGRLLMIEIGTNASSCSKNHDDDASRKTTRVDARARRVRRSVLRRGAVRDPLTKRSSRARPNPRRARGVIEGSDAERRFARRLATA